MTKFNVSRYQELKQVVNEKTIESIQEYCADPEIQEFATLEANIHGQIFYNNKKFYFTLIEKYLNKTISPDIFRYQFTTMGEKDLKKANKILNNFEELSTFWIDLESYEFYCLFDHIYDICFDAFEVEDNGMTEDIFRNLIQKSFFKIQKYSNP